MANLARGTEGEIEDWPARLDELARSGLGKRERDALGEGARKALRFCRPEGSAIFGELGAPSRARREALLGTVRDLGGPGASQVLARWFPKAVGPDWDLGPPPLPAYGDHREALAVLRADWSPKGDWLAVDHRRPSDCRFELAGGGAPWFGPSWEVPEGAGPTRAIHWRSDHKADHFEWGFTAGPLSVVRTAIVLRGRSLALIADQVSGPEGATAVLRLGLGTGTRAAPHETARALRVARAGKGGALVIAPALPRAPFVTPKGDLSISMDGATIALTQPLVGGRAWLPLVVSWDPARHRRPFDWRALTITCRGRVCPPSLAFGARVRWGDETLLIYRSLGRPAFRAVLGHQVRARTLLAEFSTEGNVSAILSWD